MFLRKHSEEIQRVDKSTPCYLEATSQKAHKTPKTKHLGLYRRRDDNNTMTFEVIEKYFTPALRIFIRILYRV